MVLFSSVKQPIDIALLSKYHEEINGHGENFCLHEIPISGESVILPKRQRRKVKFDCLHLTYNLVNAGKSIKFHKMLFHAR